MRSWPHQFVPDGKPKQINEEGTLSRPLVCVHCGKKYNTVLQPAPPNPCPARSDKREMRRLLG